MRKKLYQWIVGSEDIIPETATPDKFDRWNENKLDE